MVAITREALKKMRDSIGEPKKLEPHTFIVPESLYGLACKVMYSKVLRKFGNYVLMEYEGIKEWSRSRCVGRNYGMFPRDADENGYEIKTTKAMRKRGYKKKYCFKEWNELFPRFAVYPY